MLCGIAAVMMASAPFTALAAPPKVTPDQALQQAQLAFDQYDTQTAREQIDACRKAMKRTRSTALSAAADSLEERLDRMEQMLQRVEDIVVIDSMTVDREEFFEAYRLSPEAGGLYSASTLPEEFAVAEPTAVYMPENGQSIMWGAPDGLMESRRFTDGTWDEPTPLGSHLNLGGVANYPFMLTDGVTLYYASRGEDSLGGYDLYISRRNDNGEFLEPQNLGMPYNSPADDYMLAIDEETGAGWWATDRNRLGSRITIYVFIPSAMRVNHPITAPDLASRARIASIRATWPAGADYSDMLSRIDRMDSQNADLSPDFTLTLPDGRVYTRWSDFRSAEARRLMERYVDALEEHAADLRVLEDMRANLRRADTKASGRIRQLELKTKNAAATLKAMANQVIMAEIPSAR